MRGIKEMAAPGNPGDRERGKITVIPFARMAKLADAADLKWYPKACTAMHYTARINVNC